MIGLGDPHAVGGGWARCRAVVRPGGSVGQAGLGGGSSGRTSPVAAGRFAALRVVGGFWLADGFFAAVLDVEDFVWHS